MASTNPTSENSDPETASRPQEAEPADPPEDDTRQHEDVQADRVAIELAKKDAVRPARARDPELMLDLLLSALEGERSTQG